MALPAGDNFNRPNEALETSSDWSVGVGSLSVVSNQVDSTGSGFNIAMWVTDTFADDQFSELVMQQRDSGSFAIGTAIRLTGTGSGDTDGYGCFISNTSTAQLRWDDDVGTTLSSNGDNLSNGAVVRLKMIGSTLSMNVDTVESFSNTDSTYTSGKPGVNGVGTATSLGDDWKGGNIAGSVIAPLARKIRANRSPLIRM